MLDPYTLVSRRGFLRAGAALAAASALPASLAARPFGEWGRRVRGANERVVMGIVGTGGMGTAHLRSLIERSERDNVVVKRVCDVYKRRLTGAVSLLKGGEQTGTMEYREVLDDKDVNAVLIATPDHWHTKIAIEAMQAGKAVYVEKPLSLTVEQAIECRDVARRTKMVCAVGPQGTSDGKVWAARKAIAENRIGKVVWSQGSYCRNSREGQFNWSIDPGAGPRGQGDDYVWWDRWLGHEWDLAPKIEWNADHFFRFRKYWAYNGGVATDLMYHRLAPLLLAISGPDGEYPLRVSANGGKYIEKDERDIPDTFFLTVDYPSEHTVVLVSVMTNDDNLPAVIRGQWGSMDLESGPKLRLREQSVWHPEFRKANGIEMKTVKNDRGQDVPDPRPGQASAEIDAEARPDHMGNFLSAVRGEATPSCNIELGASTMVAIKMGVESFRQQRTLRWDAKAEKVVTL